MNVSETLILLKPLALKLDECYKGYLIFRDHHVHLLPDLPGYYPVDAGGEPGLEFLSRQKPTRPDREMRPRASLGRSTSNINVNHVLLGIMSSVESIPESPLMSSFSEAVLKGAASFLSSLSLRNPQLFHFHLQHIPGSLQTILRNPLCPIFFILKILI